MLMTGKSLELYVLEDVADSMTALKRREKPVFAIGAPRPTLF
jgi:hypothetical protein